MLPRHVSTPIREAVRTGAVPRGGNGSGAGRWPLLADDMFRVAQRDHSGVPVLHPGVAGLELAATLLGEAAGLG
ncbi:hypothetical protein KRMM14A1259_46390 [Krasilnikovia sp. MM14-A1259]